MVRQNFNPLRKTKRLNRGELNMRRFIFGLLILFGLTIPVAAQQSSDPAAAESDSTQAVRETTGEKKEKRQVIKLEEAEVEGKLSRPQVVFLLQHDEHAFRTFDIRKDVNAQLNDYVPKREMLKRYKIFYVEHLKERMW